MRVDVSSDRLTVPALVTHWASESPDDEFVVGDGRRITFGELATRTAALAAAFVGRGIGKGTRVGLLMPNSVDWAVVAIALTRIGAVIVPLSTLLRPPELEAQLRVAGVDHLVLVRTFRGRDYIGDLTSIGPLPRLRSSMIWDEDSSALDATSDEDTSALDATSGEGGSPLPHRDFIDALDQRVRPSDDLVIVFTSGSRGTPKGVIHTHGGALGATRSGLAVRGLERGDRLYIPMPFFWVGGLGTGLLSALIAGATLITEREPEAAATLQLLERERVTLFRGWPDQAAALATHPAFEATDLSRLKPASLTAVLPLARRGEPGGRSNLFGMTESFGPYSSDPLDRDLPPDKRGSCGRPFPDIEVRIADVDDGHALAPGETGEIQLRGPNMMRGICGRSRDDTFTEDGFYPTGDLGRVDADGYLFFAGRRDDMFKIKGATVYPSEVETAVMSIPGVRRAIAVDATEGSAVHVGALVVLDPNATLTIDELTREAKARLSSFKVPSAWAVVEANDIPMMATGKIDKAGVQDLLRAALVRSRDRSTDSKARS